MNTEQRLFLIGFSNEQRLIGFSNEQRLIGFSNEQRETWYFKFKQT